MVKEIPLQNDMLAIVDDEDYERVSQFNWTYTVSNGIHSKVSRFSKENQCHIYLQNFILNYFNKEEVVTFIDGNRLNFQKENLKVVNKKYVTQRKKGSRNSTSKYKGVSWNKRAKSWVSSIKYDGRSIHIGHFKNEDEAAKAYNKVAIEIFGEHAYQNVIGEDNSSEIFTTKKHLKYQKKGGVSSNYRGVCINRKRGIWVSQIAKDGKKYFLGHFKTQKEAARAYDQKAIELFGDKAILNFPEEVS